ncbi:hypothetical protein BT93_F2627 [Corymbia citriodora subsp. variegata]|nr:hypothetical protein BT93_F2627 [Corymbia citriodora subsp. variegata]
MLEFDDDAMEAEVDAAVEERKGSRKRKSRADAEADDGRGAGLAGDRRLLKRIMLSLTKPSSALGLGEGSLRSENRRRLSRLLRKLVRRHSWAEASGVLSVLLKGTCKEKCPEHNRLKYSVLLEVLEHMEAEGINPTRINNMYDIWMAKIGSKKNPSQCWLAVHLELILFFLTQGDIDKAYQNAQRLMQEQELGRVSASYLILGLTFYQRWYLKIPRDMQMIDLQTNACQQTGMLEERFDFSARNSEGYPAVYSCKASTSLQCSSETSVMKDKRPTKVPVKVEDNMEEEQSQHNIQSQWFYANSCEDEAPQSTDVGNVHCASSLSDLVGLDSWLLPIRLPQNMKNSEDFIKRHQEILNVDKDAVKYLRLALESSPTISDALLPLIQLLLIGGQVDEAFNVLDEVCHRADTALPLRVRAALLEHFAHENVVELSSCYEEILKKDPTCCHSVARLVAMHQSGDYHPGSLLEMISLHLDATYAEHQIWREFAMCFLKLARHEEDCMSVHLDGKEGGFRQNYSVCFNGIPDHLLKGDLGKNWRFRCRWWLTRHFSYSILEREIAAGSIQLLTYKAACAAHMYGQAFEYVVKVHNSLQEGTNEDLLLFLRTHLLNSIGLQSSFQPKQA